MTSTSEHNSPTSPAGGGPDLARLVRRGASWQFVNVVVNRLGQFAIGVAVARILSPENFGVFAVALVVHSVVVGINELGVSTALVRGGEDSKSAATVGTISLVSSALLTVAMIATSGLFTSLMGAPEAASAVAVMSSTVVLSGIAAVPTALLRRDFRQDRIIRADVANAVVSGIVVIALAVLGWGALALAWSRVAGQLVSTVMVFRMSPEPVRFGFDRARARRLLAYGLPLAAANALSWIVMNADFVVVSRTLGTVALGFYLLAFNVSGWPLNIFSAVIRAVSVPAFGRLRNDPSGMSDALVRGMSAVASLSFPACLILSALAGPLVVLIYGDKWAAAGPALAALGIFAAVRGVLELLVDLLVAVGRNRDVLIVQIAWLVVLVPSLVVGVEVGGILGAGMAQAAVAAFVVLPAYLFLVRRLEIPIAPVLRSAVPGLGVALAAAVAAGAVAQTFATSQLLGVLLGGLTGLVIVLGLNQRTVRRYLASRGAN